MDNIEEIIFADVIDKAEKEICQFKIGDIVWFKSERKFGIITDRCIAVDTNKPIYNVRIAPSVICHCVCEHWLSKANNLASNTSHVVTTTF